MRGSDRILMRVKSRTALLGGLLLGLGAGVWSLASLWQQSEPQSSSAPAMGPVDAVPDPSELEREPAHVPADARASAPGEGGEDDLEMDSDPESSSVAGRVLDTQSAPVGGVPLVWLADGEQGGPLGISDDLGAFQFAAVPVPSFLVAENESWVTIYRARLEEAFEHDQLVGVARRTAYHGVVVSETGRSISQAQLELVHSDLQQHFPGSESVDWLCISTDSGGFLLDPAPSVQGARLRVIARGFEPETIALPPDGSQSLRVVLRALEPSALSVAGRVRLPSGEPAAGARVIYGRSTTFADAAGRFLLEPPCPVAGLDGYVALRGWQALAILDLGGRLEREHHIELDLQLEARALSIDGVVQDAAGKPRKRCQVSILDLTQMDPRSSSGSSVEMACGWASGPVRTDAQGEFRLHGLGARPYSLLVVSGRGAHLTYSVTKTSPVEAKVSVTLREEQEFGARAGLVVDGLDRPWQGLDLHLVTPSVDASTGVPALTRTDPQGRFEFPFAPLGWIELRAQVPDTIRANWWLAPAREAPLPSLRLLRVRRVELTATQASGVPEVVCAVDASGRTAAIGPGPEVAVFASWTAFPADGGSLVVEESATALQLYRRGRRIGHLPLALGVQTIHLTWP